MLVNSRLHFVDPWTVQILGSKTKFDTVRDRWSEKKKKHILPSGNSKHPTRQQELIQSGITAETAEVRAREVEATLKEKTRLLGQLNRTVAKQENRQRLLSDILQDQLANRKSTTAPMDVDDEVMLGSVSLSQMDLDEETGEMDMDADHFESNAEPTTEDSVKRAYQDLDDQRKRVQETRASIVPLKLEIKNLKDEKYAFNKFARDKINLPIPSTPYTNTKGKQKSVTTAASKSAPSVSASASVTTSQSSSSGSSKSTYTSTPSGAPPGSMDYVEATCIGQLRKDIEENNRKEEVRKITLVPGGLTQGQRLFSRQLWCQKQPSSSFRIASSYYRKTI